MAVLHAVLLSAALAAPSSAGLTAAATKVDITPDLSHGRTYMSGFGATGRKPRGVHDPLYARLLVLSDGATTVAVAGLDLLGFYRNDVEDLRRLSGFDRPGRYLLVSSTHEHSGPDTLALWGPFIGKSGVDPEYHRRLKGKIAAALRDLADNLEPARLAAAETELDPRGLCRDSRDPSVIDPFLRVLGVQAASGKRLATLVNWSCHPEVLGSDNRLITADFPGPLCDRVEERTGGACVYLSGAIGGLMTPETSRDNFYESYRVGSRLAEAALKSLERPTLPSAGARLSVRTELPLIPIENSRYLLFLPALTFGHDLLDSRGVKLARWRAYWLPLKHLVFGLRESERPWIRTEVAVVELGQALLLGIPGELFPELLLGGYDGRYRSGHDLLSPGNPDPPELARAPRGPYLRELMRAPVRFVAGLANDELGYIVPGYDFKVRPGKLMLPRMPGHHYEETNSIGPSATRIIVEAASRLLRPAGGPKK